MITACVVSIGVLLLPCRYLNSVAKMTCKRRSKAEERWVQLVLSLASAASFFVGNCLGWVWIRIKI